MASVDVHGPAFDIGPTAVERPEDAAGFRLDVVGVFELHVVAGHGFMDGQDLEAVAVVLAQLGFDAGQASRSAGSASASNMRQAAAPERGPG